MLRLYTTGQAAAAIGVTRQTVQNWIAAKKIRPPTPTGRTRVWTAEDVKNLRLAKEKLYPKGRGRQPKR